MAGYLISLDNEDSLRLYIKNGVYATKINLPQNGHWSRSQEGTLADYVTMRNGDNIYFFIQRKIYGIGELVNISGDCKFCNFNKASAPEQFEYASIKNELLWDEGEISVKQRWICCFKPSPKFFINGLDMDEVLSSNPSAFRMLRAFWKLSFIKFDDEENQAFKDAILKLNMANSNGIIAENSEFDCDFSETHSKIENMVHGDDFYKINVTHVLHDCAHGSLLGHEMAIEAGILYQLSLKDAQTIDILGEWDYLSHQVIASPFKPIDYMDKMDVFGYSYILGFKPTKSNFLIAELKKDKATEEDILQLMKYVDWVKDEYCFGDYSMINAFLIASDFQDNMPNLIHDVVQRRFTIGTRPTKSKMWNKVKLIKYSFNSNDSHIDLSNIDD